MDSISLILCRQYNIEETQGIYIIMQGLTELFRCCCIELPWLNNIQDKSCIPGQAVYTVSKISTPEHPNSFLIENVPGRDGIMIHIGNFATGTKIDTLGCQCPGLNFVDLDGNGTPDVSHSTEAMAILNKYLPNTFKLYIS
jgi:Family of unknown function (DUF5675)